MEVMAFMKKEYISPESTIILFNEKNMNLVIATSDECGPFDDIPCGEGGCDLEGIGCTPGVG